MAFADATMFDISFSELLILGIVTLIFVGPKELPVFMRTLGKYAGMLRRQAAEFRSHFDAAMREAELDGMRQEVEAMQSKINSEVMAVKQSIHDAAAPPASAKTQLEKTTDNPPMPLPPAAAQKEA